MAKTPLARVLGRFYRGLLQVRRILWTVASLLFSRVLSDQAAADVPLVMPGHLLLFALLMLFGYSLELGLLVFVSRQPHSEELLSELADEVQAEPDKAQEIAKHEPDPTRIS
jgi:hypothetical protein